jgi:hypothetical protein
MPAYLNSVITVEKVAHLGPDFRWRYDGEERVEGQ